VLLQNSLNLAGNRALSDFDTRHHFVFSGFYSFPFKQNRRVSGWQVGVISTAQSSISTMPRISSILGVF